MRYAIVSGGLLVLLASTIPGVGADNAPSAAAKVQKANYELASQWTSQKVGRLVFDTAVTPHWLESGDRFWYTFESNKGLKFYLVDPIKKTRTFVFDPVKLAAGLTARTGIPYDSQHLPITVIRFVNNDTAIQFEINVPREAVIPGEKKSTTTTTTQQTDAAQHQQQQQERDDLDVPQQQGGRGAARQHPYIDIERVGIWGHSGGGFMTAAALLIYPDFFKVGWSESGNHENNIYNNTWSEKHHGVKEVVDKDGKVTFEYTIEKNSDIARNLKGHLMLITGDMDNNVHPTNTYRLADAFIKANKRFDFMILPGQRHAYANFADYVAWRRADYFAQHLLGESDQTIDMWQLNRERQDKPAATPPARATVTQQQQNGRGGRRGGDN